MRALSSLLRACRRPGARGLCAPAKPSVSPRVPAQTGPPASAEATGAGAAAAGYSVHLASGAIGLFAGAFGSLAGLGGGVVMVPLLTSFAGLSQHAAHGTSLVAVVSTGLGGCVSFASHGQVDWPAAAAIAATASLSAVAGARATSRLSGATLKRLMGVFMMAVAPLVPLKGYLQHRSSAGGERTCAADAEQHAPLSYSALAQCAAVGVFSGALSGMFGVGGGSIVTPALAFIADMPHQAVLGTTLAAMVLPSMIGARTHWQMGNVAVRALPGLLAGTALGAMGGAQLAMVVPQEALRWFFCGAFLLLGAKGAFKL
ncbi:hypothetical protein KFE25_001044 [Diacronema lutheri]|uniref:Membrane transporter protein n=2 Tax=Diacronema lutheri TaxID=2081491 RepID=A0A8J5XLZ6_DIALT|nr:hypothetical protein KFE25_001044 [Diacronema lutheri]